MDQINKILKTDKDVFSWIGNGDWFYGITDIVPAEGSKVEVNGKPIDPTSFLGKAAIFERTRMQISHLKLEKGIWGITINTLMWTLRGVTHQQLIERDMFRERIQGGEALYMHEMLYPVLQGIDSVVLGHIYGSCDLEIGGSDQLFNMRMGRDLMRNEKQEPQSVLSLKLLEGTDGKEKMSKSIGNYIAITDEPVDMFGKVMSIPDTSVLNYFELCAVTPREEAEKKLNHDGPFKTKLALAHEIVGIYHTDAKAEKAEKEWLNMFSKREAPENMKSITVPRGTKLSEVFIKNSVVSSNSEFKRLVEQGAITDLDREKNISDAGTVVEDTVRLKIGKKNFLKIIVD